VAGDVVEVGDRVEQPPLRAAQVPLVGGLDGQPEPGWMSTTSTSKASGALAGMAGGLPWAP
jgi:hypothetical protein